MVPRALVTGIAILGNVERRVGPTPAEMAVVGPAVPVVAGYLHLLQLVERHEVHAVHGTGLFYVCAFAVMGQKGGEETG
jgi:hypothetical protein